jgi:hypothetical protein
MITALAQLHHDSGRLFCVFYLTALFSPRIPPISYRVSLAGAASACCPGGHASRRLTPLDGGCRRGC